MAAAPTVRDTSRRAPVSSDVGCWSVVVSFCSGSLGEEFDDLVLEPCVHGVLAREARLRSRGCCECVFEDRAHLSRCFEAEAYEPLPTSWVDAIGEASFSGGSDALDETDADHLRADVPRDALMACAIGRVA